MDLFSLKNYMQDLTVDNFEDVLLRRYRKLNKTRTKIDVMFTLMGNIKSKYEEFAKRSTKE